MPQSIQEYLGVPASWPVRENIKHEIALMPNKQDKKNAIQGDPRRCALHNAACRMFDIPNCAIGAVFAYIPQRDARGNWYIARMRATAETCRAVRKFDETGEMPEGGFRFGPVNPCNRLGARKAYKTMFDKGGRTGTGTPRRGMKSKRRRKVLRAIPSCMESA